jgi:hypothetical protein
MELEQSNMKYRNMELKQLHFQYKNKELEQPNTHRPKEHGKGKWLLRICHQSRKSPRMHNTPILAEDEPLLICA